MRHILAAIFGRKHDPPPSGAVAMPIAAPHMPTGAHENPGTAFLRLAQSRAYMAPRDASVTAFLAWLRELGEAGTWVQEELYQEYRHICHLSGTDGAQMPAKWFGKALEDHGCRRWKAELLREGHRWRPMMVTIPDEAPAGLAHVATKAAAMPHASPMQANVYPLRSIGREDFALGKQSRGQPGIASLPKNGWQRKGAYRADIVEAVAYR